MMEDTFYLDISVSKQELSLVASGRTLVSYPVSTARNGMGEKKGSECTPTGWHKIKAKIGSAMPKNSVFVGRRPTGEIYSAELGKQFPHRDWILSRILWLVGLEAGKNRYGHVDTGWRYIYIHGTADESDIGTPASHGCIRMNNDDVIDLFARVDTGTKVFIHK